MTQSHFHSQQPANHSAPPQHEAEEQPTLPKLDGLVATVREKATTPLAHVAALAAAFATGRGSQEINTMDFLAGIIHEGRRDGNRCVAYAVLADIADINKIEPKMTPEIADAWVAEKTAAHAANETVDWARIIPRLSPAARIAIHEALAASGDPKNPVSTEHLMLGMLKGEPDQGVPAVMAVRGVSPESFELHMQQIFGGK